MERSPDEEGSGGLYERLVLASRRESFHKRHDGLAAVVEQELGLDPYSGVAVVFRGRGHADEVKVLWWDGRSLGLSQYNLFNSPEAAGTESDTVLGRRSWTSIPDRHAPNVMLRRDRHRKNGNPSVAEYQSVLTRMMPTIAVACAVELPATPAMNRAIASS